MKNIKKISSIFLCLILTLCLLFGCAKSGDSNIDENIIERDEYVAFFETDDDADCALIHIKDNNILIDTGEKDDAKDIMKFLEKNSINKIDYLIISHFDKDHCGGVEKILQNYQVVNFLRPKYVEDKKASQKALESVKNKGVTETVIDTVTEMRFDTISLCFYPTVNEFDNKPSNNSSLIVKLTYLEKSMLFTGDIESERVNEIMSGDTSYLDCDLLKVPYHGRPVEDEQSFVNAVSPEISIVTGSGSKVKKNIKSLGESLGTVYYTNDGTIIVYFDYSTGLTAVQD